MRNVPFREQRREEERPTGGEAAAEYGSHEVSSGQIKITSSNAMESKEGKTFAVLGMGGQCQ